ncbi:MAG: DsbE family thiol:disulfide interchange protein [Burkholderiales bacterium]
MTRFLFPLAMFVVLVAFLGLGLQRNPREIPSPLIDKPAPLFQLAQLHQAQKVFTPKEMLGQVWLFNVWASWCASCRLEHPLLVDLAQSGAVPVYGLNYKDRREDAIAWLVRHGNPYQLSVWDGDGRVGIDYGVYGVPETYVIDRSGNIRYKQTGPLTLQLLESTIIPLVKELRR